MVIIYIIAGITYFVGWALTRRYFRIRWIYSKEYRTEDLEITVEALAIFWIFLVPLYVAYKLLNWAILKPLSTWAKRIIPNKKSSKK